MVALAIHPAETRDLMAFHENGWKLCDPADVASTPWDYQLFIQGSKGEFGIAKSGELQFIEKRHSSGVELLDDYAMRAVQLASPFPPVPDAISKGGLPINGIFRYHILGSGLINNYLR